MATYYVRADGTAVNKEAATSDSAASTSMALTTACGESYSPDDVVVISDEGGVYRSMLWAMSSGTAGHPVVVRANSGGSPVLKASDLVPGWTVHSGSVYQAALTTEPQQIWVDGTYGDRKTSTEACVNEYDWYWVSNVLYIYAPGDPDTEYTDPGVEAGVRSYCVNFEGTSYVSVDGLRVMHGNLRSFRCWNSSHITVDNCIVEWSWLDGFNCNSNAAGGHEGFTIRDSIFRYNGVQGIAVTMSSTNSTMTDITIQRNKCYENGKHQGEVAYDHSWVGGIKIWTDPDTGEAENVLVEQNECYDNGGNGAYSGVGIWFDYVENDGTNPNIVRHNVCYDNGIDGIFLEIASGVHIYGNLLYNNGTTGGTGIYSPAGIRIDARPGATHDSSHDNLVYNNTCVGAANGIHIGVTDVGGSARVDDNIVDRKSVV